MVVRQSELLQWDTTSPLQLLPHTQIAEIYYIAEATFPVTDMHADEDVEESFAYVDADKIREQLRAFPAYRSYVEVTPITKAGAVAIAPDAHTN